MRFRGVILVLFVVLFSSVYSLDVPSGITVTTSGDTLTVSWEPVPGASGYNVFYSQIENPADWGNPVATVQTTVYRKMLRGNKGYFRVTALRNGPDMVSVPSASFTMGDTHGSGSADEYPNHTVHISGFDIGTYEVTHAQTIEVFNWAATQGEVVCTGTSVTNASGDIRELLDIDDLQSAIIWTGDSLTFNPTAIAPSDQTPCIEITWYGAAAYCNYLSMMEGLSTCYDLADWSCDWAAYGYRLPTEAEWELAARGGTDTPNFLYSGSDNINDAGWCYTNSDTGSGRQLHPVGLKNPNGAGACDMSGNVWEWCWDYPGGYVDIAQSDPTGPYSGSNRVIRGGSWNHSASNCRVSDRFSVPPSSGRSYYFVGFRVAKNAAPRMIHVPAGSFQMGRTGVATPIHTVNLDAFHIGKYEVTQQEWVEVMGSNPSYFTGDLQRPVEMISWYDVVKYCNYRSIQEGLTPVYSVSGDTNPDNWGATFDPDVNWSADGYRLPTEAEWEYSARGATNTPDYLYAGSDNIDDVAWYVDNSGSTTHPVGGKQANGIGTHDQSGNVHEWCWDWYSSSYYSSSPADNPTGPATGSFRVLRGGSSNTNSNYCRVANRYNITAVNTSPTLGFRLARTAPGYGTNTAPDEPANPSPADAATDVSPSVSLTWSCSDPDGDPLTYDIYMGTAPGVWPDSLVASGIADTTYAPAGLQDNTTYYWTVVASDGAWVNQGTEWSFTTGESTLDGFILVPAGSFQMGRTGVAEPIHTVNLDAFYIGTYEVTQQEWVDVMGSNPSYFTGDMQRPVETVSWYDVVKYCNYRSIQEGLTPVYSVSGDTNPDNWGASFDPDVDWNANGYRLPTEAEWEYSARGATNTPDYLYAGSDNIDDVAWCGDNSGSTTHPVGEKQANGIGTYDQSGNVYEWCWDWYSSSYYGSSPGDNPTGPSSGSDRVVRGGFWFSTYHCWVASRYDYYPPSTSSSALGFRLCRTAE